jgi:hypothetical protein
LTVNADGSLTYVPAAGFSGVDAFAFSVSDGSVNEEAIANITVTGAQIFLPNASFSTASGQTLTVDAADGLLNGATDPSGSSLQMTGISAAGNLPSSWYWDSIQPVGGAYLNTVSNTTIAKGDFYGFVAPGTLFLPTENMGTIGSPFTLPSGSTVTVNADGSFTYIPAAGFTGQDSFSFTVSDGSATATAECDISVVAPQLEVSHVLYMETMGQTLTVDASNGLLQSAYDSTGAAVTVTAVNGTALTNGSATVTLASGSNLTVNSDGSFTYTSAAGLQGADDFSFTASDGTLTATANCEIFVSAPLLEIPDTNYSTTIGRTLTVDATNGLLWSVYDSTGGATVTVTAVNGTSLTGGSATVTLASGSTLTVNSDGSFTYIPAAGFQGDDAFSFTASDGTISTTTNGDIYVVTPQLGVLDPYYTATTGQTLTVNAGAGLLQSVYYTGAAAVTVTSVNGTSLTGGSATVTLASGSTLTVNSDGSFTYTPAVGFQGDDTFSFTASDGVVSQTANGDINVSAPFLEVPDSSYTGTPGQTLAVNAANGLLESVYDSTGAAVTVTAVNGTSLTGGSATVTLASGSTLTVNSDGSFTYVPAANFQGDDTFTFTASDGAITSTANGDVNVAPPELDVFDASYVAGTGQTLNVDAGAGLLAYVYDSTGNPLTITAVNGVAANVGTPITLSPSGATLTVNTDGSFTYVAAPGFQGDDTFTFTVSDGLISATGNADVNVMAPQIYLSSPSYSTLVGQTLNADSSSGLLAYAADSVNNAMTVTAVNGSAANVGTAFTLASGATVTVNADGSFTYVPAAGYQGQDTFDFTVGDGSTSSTATATINVVTPALTVPDRFYGSDGQGLSVDASNGLLAWVQDPTGGTVQVTAVNGSAANVGTATTLPSGATLTVNADGSFTYVPAASSTGTSVKSAMRIASLIGSDSFTFTVSDGTLSSTATATIYSKLVPIGVLPPIGLPIVSMPPVSTEPISLPPIFIGDSGPNSVDYTLAMSATPQALTVKPNALVTLTAPTTGNQPQPVQWQVSTNNGKTWTNVPMSSAVQANKLVVTANSSTSNDQYRAQLVSTSKGKAAQTTNAVALNVVKAPSVAVQASTLKTAAGKKVTLTATVKGTASQIQWQVQTGGSNAWSNISGATSLSYSFTAGATDNGSRYRVIVDNAAGTADSTPVTLAVTFPPTVTLPPTAQTVLVGTKATFTATASANPAPAIQWQASVNNGKTWVNLQNGPSVQGVHTGTLSITTKSAENGEQFRAVFTSGKTSVASSAAVLTVQTPVPVVTVKPASQTVFVNAQATFVAAATGATAVQWQISTDDGQTWTNVRGATTKTLHLKASLAKNGEQVRAVFSNVGGATPSQAATLTVVEKT